MRFFIPLSLPLLVFGGMFYLMARGLIWFTTFAAKYVWRSYGEAMDRADDILAYHRSISADMQRKKQPEDGSTTRHSWFLS